jgi:hypothetical protein
MHIRLRIHPRHERSLASHLAAEGFPPTATGNGELEVLFPGSALLFAAAAQLDLWEARCDCVTGLVIEPPTLQRRRALPSR